MADDPSIAAAYLAGDSIAALARHHRIGVRKVYAALAAAGVQPRQWGGQNRRTDRGGPLGADELASLRRQVGAALEPAARPAGDHTP